MEQLIEGQALLGGPGGALGNHYAGYRSVLVAHELTDIEAVAFLTAADELALALVLAHDLLNVLESGQHIVALHSETTADLGDQLSRHDGLGDVLRGIQLAEFLPAGEDVICQDGSCLVAVQLNHLAFVVTNSDSKAVSVRVGGHHDVSPLFVGHFQSHLHSGRLLRIRGYNCREVPVTNVLIRHVDNILETKAFQSLWHNADSCSVKRSVNDLQVLMLLTSLRAEGQ